MPSESDNRFEVDKGTAATIRRGSSRRQKAAKPKSKHKQRQIEQRAKWIFREWSRSPRCGYNEMLDAVRERFGIGITGAELAYSRALEICHETTIDTNTIERMSLELQTISDRAFHAGKYNAAVRAVLARAALHGVAAPQRHEVSVTTVQQMQHLVMAMTPTQRAQRERELLGRVEPIDVPEVVGLSPAGASAMASIIDEELSGPIVGDDEVADDEDDRADD